MSDAQRTHPVVSVIMPTYNQAEFIVNAIESVLNQSYQSFELIIIDNYSEDNTEKVVESYKDKRIRYSKFRNNGIIAASRNHGIRQSRGEYIAFLDSDDAWHRQKLEMQLAEFKQPDIIGVACDSILIPETAYYRKNAFGRSKVGYIDYQYDDILNRNSIATSSVILRKDTLERVGGFDENIDFAFIEDWELWLRVSKLGSFRVLGIPLLSYTVSRKRGYNSVILAKNCLKVLEKQISMGFADFCQIVEPKASIYLSIARNLIEYDAEKSKKYYKKAFKATSNPRKKIKSCAGTLIAINPLFLRKMLLLMFYRLDSLIYNIKDQIWQIKNGGSANLMI